MLYLKGDPDMFKPESNSNHPENMADATLDPKLKKVIGIMIVFRTNYNEDRMGD